MLQRVCLAHLMSTVLYVNRRCCGRASVELQPDKMAALAEESEEEEEEEEEDSDQ